MKINNTDSNYNISSKGILNNKLLLKSLETVSEHGTSFIAGTTLIMSSVVRPTVISLTPNTDKKNKQYTKANSIISGLIKFALVEAIALPVEKAIKQIDNNPNQFLNSTTIQNLKASSASLAESRNYKFITQLLKQSVGFLTAIPKSILTVALIPIIMDVLFKNKKQNSELNMNSQIYNQYNPIFENDFQNKSKPSFKGNTLINETAKGISKIINSPSIQNFAEKFYTKDANIARNYTMATDLLLTASFIHQTKKSKKIEENKKNLLIANNVISTGFTLLFGYSIDKLIKKGTENLIKKFSEINKADPKLNKYIEGINIVRPTLVFAAVYYGILPIFSTYLADKIDKLSRNKLNNSKNK